MPVVSIRKEEKSETKATKLVSANQKAIDALPLDSGMWRVQGVPGLYVRCRAISKSFMQQRRVDGVLVKKVLGPVTMQRAKQLAMDNWNAIAPAAPAEEKVFLGPAIEVYIKNRMTMKKMVERTALLARYNTKKYLESWKNKTLDEVGRDRPALAALHARLSKSPASCNQVMRLLSAVYRWHRDRVELELAEWPRKVAELHSIKARDWAYNDDELRAWWHHTAEKKKKDSKDGTKKKFVRKGVSVVGPLKRAWWLTTLLTGARAGSVEALRWQDVDLEKKTIHFAVAKGGRVYSIPICEKLAELLRAYRDSGSVAPSPWLFPSIIKDGDHVKAVKNIREGVGPAHRLRHSYRTALAQVGASPDQARMLLGHSLTGDVSRGYITSSLVIESLRPVSDAVANHYMKILSEHALRCGTPLTADGCFPANDAKGKAAKKVPRVSHAQA